MNRIERIFADLRGRGRAALMPFITGGYPSLSVTEEVIPELEEAGASMVEVGFPFSDPIADGPVIASSMHEALEEGITPLQVFEAIERVRGKTEMGLIAMVSCSIVRRMGEEEFVRRASAAGFDGLIVPDLDVEDAESFAGMTARHDLTLSLLVAPTTPEDRLEAIVKRCSGFVYVLSRVGVTGETGNALPGDLIGRLQILRRYTDLPLAVGFGISTADQVAKVTKHAEAAIVGSALVRCMGEAGDPVRAARELVSGLAKGLRGNCHDEN